MLNVRFLIWKMITGPAGAGAQVVTIAHPPFDEFAIKQAFRKKEF